MGDELEAPPPADQPVEEGQPPVPAEGGQEEAPPLPEAAAPGDSKGAEDKERERSRSRARSGSQRRSDRERSSSRKRRERSRSRERRSSRRDRSRSRDRHRRRRSRSRSRHRRSRSRSRHRRSRSRSRSRRHGTRSRSPPRPVVPVVAPIVPGMLPGMAALPGGLNPALLGMSGVAGIAGVPGILPGMTGGMQSVGGGLSEATRRQRELYIGNLPIPCLGYQLQTFLNNVLITLGLTRTPSRMPVMKCDVSPGGKFAFVELADVQDTTNAMCLDGLPYMGTVLRIGRPKGYTPTLNAPPDPAPLGHNVLQALLSGQEGVLPPGMAAPLQLQGPVPPDVVAAVTMPINPAAFNAPGPGGSSGGGGAGAMAAQSTGLNPATRRQRELYIGSLPNPCLNYQLQTFLNQTMLAIGLNSTPGRMPVVKCEVSPGGGFAFVEFAEVVDATCAMCLDGIPFMGVSLRIGRPKGYAAPLGTPPDPQPLGPAALQVLQQQAEQNNPHAIAALAAAAGSAAPGPM